jgi:hypothetical protein
VRAPAGVAGFGCGLVQRTVTGQLGGAIDYAWSEGGLIVTLRMDRARLAS